MTNLVVGSPEWLQERRAYLGASEFAAVMGVSPWTTPVELWLEKLGRKAPTGVPDPARRKVLERGRVLEPYIRAMAIAKLESMGLEVELLACNERYADPVFPFLRCEIDFELRVTGTIYVDGTAIHLDREVINADAKSVGSFARKKWGDEETEQIPIEYAAQFAGGLMITPGMRRICCVAALLSMDDVGIYWLLRDEETITAMREKLSSFWNDHVLTANAPDTMVFSDITKLFARDNGDSIEATPEILEKCKQLRLIKEQIKTWEESEEVLSFEVADFISPNAILTHNGKPIVTWKARDDTRLDQKRLKADMPELVEQYSHTKPVRVLLIKKALNP